MFRTNNGRPFFKSFFLAAAILLAACGHAHALFEAGHLIRVILGTNNLEIATDLGAFDIGQNGVLPEGIDVGGGELVGNVSLDDFPTASALEDYGQLDVVYFVYGVTDFYVSGPVDGTLDNIGNRKWPGLQSNFISILAYYNTLTVVGGDTVVAEMDYPNSYNLMMNKTEDLTLGRLGGYLSLDSFVQGNLDPLNEDPENPGTWSPLELGLFHFDSPNSLQTNLEPVKTLTLERDADGVFGTSAADVTSEPATPGDVDGDGDADLADVVIALQVAGNIVPDPIPETGWVRGDYAASGADVDGDGRVGFGEASYGLQVQSGLRTP